MTNRTAFATLAAITGTFVGCAALGIATLAQEPAKPGTAPESLAAIDGLYQKELSDIERRRLDRLAALAAKQPPQQANDTYALYFRAAINANLFTEAEPVADQILKAKQTPSHVLLLADVVKIMAFVGRGAYEQSVTSIASALGTAAGDAAHALSVGDKVTLLDAYFQRLAQANQFAVASKAFTIVRDRTSDPSIKAFAVSRLARLDLVGKPAPALAGNDLDGRPVQLANLRGNAVLVVFWASWCLNNAEEIARLDAAYAAYRDKGFRIIGVSLDSLDESEKSPAAIRTAVRHFVLDHNVRWPNLINGTGAQDYSAAYAVTEVPANVLIGRDGTIIGLDLTGANLDKSVAQAVQR